MANMVDMQDYYKNLTLEDIRECVDLDQVFMAWRSYYHPYFCDLYFWGIKKTIETNYDDDIVVPSYKDHDHAVIQSGNYP